MSISHKEITENSMRYLFGKPNQCYERLLRFMVPKYSDCLWFCFYELCFHFETVHRIRNVFVPQNEWFSLVIRYVILCNEKIVSTIVRDLVLDKNADALIMWIKFIYWTTNQAWIRPANTFCLSPRQIVFQEGMNLFNHWTELKLIPSCYQLIWFSIHSQNITYICFSDLKESFDHSTVFFHKKSFILRRPQKSKKFGALPYIYNHSIHNTTSPPKKKL